MQKAIAVILLMLRRSYGSICEEDNWENVSVGNIQWQVIFPTSYVSAKSSSWRLMGAIIFLKIRF